MNKVFIATSLDGFIADKNGEIDWLNAIANPDGIDMGYDQFMSQIDALLMGRNTFDTVCNFDIEWPYSKPVFVLSSTLKTVPEKYKGKVEIVNGPLKDVVGDLNSKGFNKLYIDGGKTIQSFLKEDLIDELILTTIPILLGGGSPLFGELAIQMEFEHVKSELYLDSIVQNSYKRKRK